VREIIPPRARWVAGRFELRARLGQGGSATVVEAFDHDQGKVVALKLLHSSLASDAELRARFAREAHALSKLTSEHIVRVLASGTDGEDPYLVMDRLYGEDLGARLHRCRRMSVEETVTLAIQVLRGLSDAHAAKLVHRDLKPDNLFLVDGEPRVKLLDFGISKLQADVSSTQVLALTGNGTAMGTPLYMSPEQARGQADVDARADLYALGAILFECLAGRPPHVGESDAEVILSICTRDAPDLRLLNPAVPEAFAAFVARAMQRDRERRWSSAEEMRAELEHLAGLSSDTPDAPHLDVPHPRRSPLSARATWLLALLAVLAGIVTTLGLLALSGR
jgi:serine/threonine protein kinase